MLTTMVMRRTEFLYMSYHHEEMKALWCRQGSINEKILRHHHNQLQKPNSCTLCCFLLIITKIYTIFDHLSYSIKICYGRMTSYHVKTAEENKTAWLQCWIHGAVWFRVFSVFSILECALCSLFYSSWRIHLFRLWLCSLFQCSLCSHFHSVQYHHLFRVFRVFSFSECSVCSPFWSAQCVHLVQ